LLRNKTAIISGATKGIGFSMAKVFSEDHGAFTIVCSRDINRAKLAANQINGRCMPEQVDVSDEISVRNLVKRVMAKHGRIDILINNGGGPPFDKFENFDDEAWQKAFELTLLSFARASRLVLPHMQKTGSGRIINIISGSVKSVLANSVLSTSMRMGVVGMAKMMADEFGPYHITVNNVAPGMILTDRLKHTLPKDANPEEALKEKARKIPLGRIGKPEELAALVTFLVSEQAAYISGTTIQVDGGANRGIF